MRVKGSMSDLFAGRYTKVSFYYRFKHIVNTTGSNSREALSFKVLGYLIGML